MSKKIVGFGAAFQDEEIPKAAFDKKNLLELINEASEDELLVIQDVIRDKFGLDRRLTKIPDLINSEFSVFDNRKIEKGTEKVLDIRRRRYIAFVYLYSHPDRTDDQMVSFIQLGNPYLSYIEAVRDLSNIKLVIGNLPRARRELVRIQEIEMHKKAYQKALEKENEQVMTMAARNMGKAAGDKDELEIPWDQMITQAFEITDDITVTGRIRLPEKELDAKIDKLKKRYDPDVTDAEEVA
jgi:hypothetical protein